MSVTITLVLLSLVPLPMGVDPSQPLYPQLVEVVHSIEEGVSQARAPPPLLAPEPGGGTPPDPSTPPFSGFVEGVLLSALLGLAVAGGARIVRRDEVLENSLRRRLYEYLRLHPGVHLKRITEDLHLTTTNALWHLHKLERADLIHSDRFNGLKIFYATEGGIEARRVGRARAALSHPHARAIAQLLCDSPTSSTRALADRLRVNHGTVRWHLRKLKEAGVLKEEGGRIEVTWEGKQALGGSFAFSFEPLTTPS